MTTEETLIISDGPSADRMIDSFKYAFGAEKLPITLRVGIVGENSLVIKVIVKSLAYKNPRLLHFEADITKGGRGRISGLYDAQSRTGSASKVS